MSSILPKIDNGGVSMVGRAHESPTIKQYKINSTQKETRIPSSIKIVDLYQNKRRQTEHDKKIFKPQITQPILSQIETAKFRNTIKHNLCLDILEHGFHRSFSELFTLVLLQNERRLAAGPESVIWTQILLENEPEKLEIIKTYLIEAELAFRNRNFVAVYKAQHKLAEYFKSIPSDKWLCDHFYQSCLRTATEVVGDEGILLAEGHYNMGTSLEENGLFLEAARNFELFYQLSAHKPEWCLDGGRNMQFVACNSLCRIYTTIANNFLNTDDLSQYLQYLQQAHNMAKEAGDKKLIGEASFRLGLAFEKNKDSDTALMHLQFYYETCRAYDDSDGLGKACEAIAKSYDSKGMVEESIKHLEEFVQVAEASKNDKAISRACSNLGATFNSLGRYEQAVEYFNKAYNISRALSDTASISSSRVLFGAAAAHRMLPAVAQHIHSCSAAAAAAAAMAQCTTVSQTSEPVSAQPTTQRVCLDRLIEWKDNRGDEFEKPMPSQPNPKQ